ncbi:MAG: hypothetical protein QXQ40_00360 [Candidatus Aenigmatarchaeota archaeon]
MKGFIRIIEVVIVSLVLLALLPYFFSTYIEPFEWDLVSLETQARDALIALDETGYLREFILSNNVIGLEDYLTKMLPNNAIFEVEVSGIPKSHIKIGCNCTEEEKNRLRRMLHIFTPEDKKTIFRGREIEFSIDENSGIETLLERPIDLILFFGYKNLSKEKLEEFLDEDKALVMIADLDEMQPDELFNLSWKDTENPSIVNIFNEWQNPNAFKIAEDFVDMPIRIDTTNNGKFWIQDTEHTLITGYNDTEEYVKYDTNEEQYKINETIVIDGWWIKVVDIDANLSDDGRTYADIMIINRSYRFYINDLQKNKIEANEKTILKTTNNFSSVQANYQITKYGKGRAIWFKDYNEMHSDINQLFKSLLLWAAGKKYNLEYESLGQKKERPNRYTSVNYFVSGNQEFEPYIISLILWYAY